MFNNVNSKLNIKPSDKVSIKEQNHQLLTEWQSINNSITNIDEIDNTTLNRITTIKQKLVVNNINLVRRIAHHYDNNNYGLEYEDIEAIGVEGLTKAINRFDTTELKTFSTYLYNTINGEIKRYFRDKGTLIRRPQIMKEGEVNYSLTVIDDAITQVYYDSEDNYAQSPIDNLLSTVDNLINTRNDKDFLLSSMENSIGKGLYWETFISDNSKLFMMV